MKFLSFALYTQKQGLCSGIDARKRSFYLLRNFCSDIDMIIGKLLVVNLYPNKKMSFIVLKNLGIVRLRGQKWVILFFN